MYLKKVSGELPCACVVEQESDSIWVRLMSSHELFNLFRFRQLGTGVSTEADNYNTFKGNFFEIRIPMYVPKPESPESLEFSLKTVASNMDGHTSWINILKALAYLNMNLRL